jgi:hypothetical protein
VYFSYGEIAYLQIAERDATIDGLKKELRVYQTRTEAKLSREKSNLEESWPIFLVTATTSSRTTLI